MGLQVTGTWDQALLAATAREATRSGAGGYLGRTALQKILYFLQISGVPMRYRFDLYHYGPYCDLISRDVEWMLADGVLRDASLNPDRYSSYRISDIDAAELMEKHQEALDEYGETIQRVVHALLPIQPENLEILATLDYLYRQLRAGGGQGPWKKRVVDRFLDVKKDKFERTQVTTAYEALLRAKLVEE